MAKQFYPMEYTAMPDVGGTMYTPMQIWPHNQMPLPPALPAPPIIPAYNVANVNAQHFYQQSVVAQHNLQSFYSGRPIHVPMPPMYQAPIFRKPFPKMPWRPRQRKEITYVAPPSNVNQNGVTKDPDAAIMVPPMNPPPPKKKKKNCGVKQEPPVTTRKWSLEESERALEVEFEYRKRQNDKSLVLKFPDPELNINIVKEMHCSIDTVHFQTPSNPRYCFIQLSDDADVEKAIEDLNKVKFGNGYLAAERKTVKEDELVGPENIDPTTLYVGNLPLTVRVNVIKEQFPGATRHDVGYAKKMKHTRHAFVRFATADLAIEAFKNATNLVIMSRSVILKFKRINGAVAPPGEQPVKLTPEQKAAKEEKIKLRLEERDKREKKQLEKENIMPKITIKEEEPDTETEVEEEDEEISDDETVMEDDEDDDDTEDEKDDGEEEDDEDDDDTASLFTTKDGDDDDDEFDDLASVGDPYESDAGDVGDVFKDFFYRSESPIPMQKRKYF